MKRLFSLLCVLMLVLPLAGGAAEKMDAMPAIFAVKVEGQEERTKQNDRYFYKEYLQTTNQQVNEALRQAVDELDAQWRPHLSTDERKNARRNNRLDVEVNYFRKHGARVTFFVVGKMFKEGVDILQRQFDANHLIASHSWEHWSGYSMKKLDSRVREAYRNDEFTLDVLGEGAKYFRAPGGTYPPWVEAKIGMPIIQWSVDTYDFRGANEKRILQNISKNVRDGDIILMHDTGERLHKAIPLFADWLWEHGYMMVSIEELALAQGVTMEPNVVYHRFANGDYSERRDSNTN